MKRFLETKQNQIIKMNTNTETQPKYYNFENLGIDRLVEILALWKRKITNMKSSSIPLEKRKAVIISAIRKVIQSNPNHKHFLVINSYFAPKEKAQPKIDNKLFTYKKGDLVIHDVGKYRTKYVLAKVVKINEKSITIQLDTYRTILDEKAMRDQTYGSHRLIWNECFWGDKVVIKDSNKIYSKQDCLENKNDKSFYIEYFTEGKEDCDFGN